MTALYIMAAVGFVSCLTCVTLVVGVLVYCWRNPVEQVEPPRPVREPVSVADGFDWRAEAEASMARHRARRRGVTHV